MLLESSQFVINNVAQLYIFSSIVYNTKTVRLARYSPGFRVFVFSDVTLMVEICDFDSKPGTLSH